MRTTGHPEYEHFLIFDNGIDSEQRIWTLHRLHPRNLFSVTEIVCTN